MMDYSKQRFERLFKDSYPHMYRMSFSMVEDADDAKDAVNQVFTQMNGKSCNVRYSMPILFP